LRDRRDSAAIPQGLPRDARRSCHPARAPWLVMAGASLPGYRSPLPALAGTVNLGSAQLQLPMAAE
jgi:hypothetical protein